MGKDTIFTCALAWAAMFMLLISMKFLRFRAMRILGLALYWQSAILYIGSIALVSEILWSAIHSQYFSITIETLAVLYLFPLIMSAKKYRDQFKAWGSVQPPPLS